MKTRIKQLTLVLSVLSIISFANLDINGQDLKSETQSDLFQAIPGENPHAFIGTWIVQTVITDCSGTTTESFSKFVSIHAGGTANENSNSLPASQRTTAFGVWEHLGQRDFVYAIRFFRFNADGTFNSTVQAKWSVLMGEEGDAYTATSTIRIVLPNGTVINRCGSEAGTRMMIP